MTQTAPVLTTRRLSKAYGARQAVSDPDLEVRPVAAGLILGFGCFAVDSLLLIAALRLPALASQGAGAVHAIVVVAVWLAALLVLSYRLLARRDVLE